MTSIISKIDYKLVKRWFLEMTIEPADLNPVFPKDTEIRLFEGGCEEYRALNKLVGGDLGWVDRQIMHDEDLTKIISHPEVKIYVLFSGEEQLGFAELDHRTKSEVHMEYFGLVPEARGKGLGKAFLNWALTEAWKSKPKKLRLNTCEIDHPSALPIYLKAGFKIVDERIERQAFFI
ncbi:MAG TPA: GNAT family N-acetyltransferase [Prolixibacteraceae bacterium]